MVCWRVIESVLCVNQKAPLRRSGLHCSCYAIVSVSMFSVQHCTIIYTILPNIQLIMHTFTHRWQPCKATASLVVRVRRLAQGHLNTELKGAGDQTCNLPVTSQPTLPSEPHTAPSGLVSVSMLSAQWAYECWVPSELINVEYPVSVSMFSV